MRTGSPSGPSVRGDRPKLGALSALCFAFALCAVAHANMGRLDTDPSIDGQILPKQETTVEIAWETLDIRFEHDYFRSKPDYAFRGVAPRAFVKAQYLLHNPTAQRIDLDLAFPVIAGHLRRDPRAGSASPGTTSRPGALRLDGSPKGVSFTVSVNDKAIPFESVPSAPERQVRAGFAQWRRAILSWMRSDSFLAGLLEKGKTTDQDRTALREYLEKRKGFTPSQARHFDNHLLAGGKPRPPARWDDDYVRYLFRAIDPQARAGIAAAFEKWRVDSRYIDPHSGALYDPAGRLGSGSGYRFERRISFATFRVTLGPRQKARLQVEYDHLINADLERARRQNRLEYQFQYILRTAGLWSKFGPIAIRVVVPEHLRAAFSLPLKYAELRDGCLVFRGSVTRPQVNLLIGLSPQLRNADFVGRNPPNLMRVCFGWLRRYHEDPSGPWADDYLLECALTLDVLHRCGNIKPYRKTREGAEGATDEEWAFLAGKTPLEVYRTVAEGFRDTNGGHRAALMLLELRYRDATFDATTYDSVESDVQRFIQERPSGWLTPNAWYLLALCRMRSDLRAAQAAFQSAATRRAHWCVRQQAERFAQALRRAQREDERLLKDWAVCEIRNAFKHDYRRRDYLRRGYVFPINQSNGLEEYWHAYRAHRDRPLSCELLKRVCLELGAIRRSSAQRVEREALGELYRRVAQAEKDDTTLRQLRLQILKRLAAIGVGHVIEPVLDALGSTDEHLRRVALRALPSADDKARVEATLRDLAESGEPKFRGEAVVRLGQMGHRVKATLRHLADSGKPAVSEEAVIQLGQMGDRSVLPRLITLLRHHDSQRAYRAYELLRSITGQGFTFETAHDPPEQREKVIRQWERWWAWNGWQRQQRAPGRLQRGTR